MTDYRDRARAASNLLWEHWRAGTRLACLPEEIRPGTRAEGYAVQALLETRSVAPLFGWKVAATSKAGQDHIGVDGPLAGRLLGENVFANGAELPLRGNQMRVAEPEFAFRMARDLLPRAEPYSVAEVCAAVDTLHPAIELPDSRYDQFTRAGAPQLIADDACAYLFVLGPPAPGGWRDFDLAAHKVVGTVDGSLKRDGEGANVLQSPLIALAWLAGELSGLGIILRAGQIVTTGTCMEPLPIKPGSKITADFGVLGTVSARFR